MSNERWDVEDYDDFEHLPQGEKSAESLQPQIIENTTSTMNENDFGLNDDGERIFTDEEFFTIEGKKAPISRYDLEMAVPQEKKSHFVETDRYWANKPFSFISIFISKRDNEYKYYVIEPHLSTEEERLLQFFKRKLRAKIKYQSHTTVEAQDESIREGVIENKFFELLTKYEKINNDGGKLQNLKSIFNSISPEELKESFDFEKPQEKVRLDKNIDNGGIDEVTENQIGKFLYYLKRDLLDFQKIDAIKHDINVEDISCNGYNQPVFVYHGEHEQIITNITHQEEELDEFVNKLAEEAEKGISKREPQVDATLPDGSRSQLTLGTEVSDHGTNYTIRQFKEIPFTPIDLINWNTFSLDQMGFLWLSIENHKSLIFAGGTASGKTTSLNAVSLFIPSDTKIVSIEDTREVELPQRNWVASVTRPAFNEGQGGVDEFDLLEAALRQRPDYIVMGEIRGEEGRTLFQVMSTGHTTYTTFHADSVEEVLKRFTTDPINVSKTLFTALDLVSIQTQTRVDGKKVRRSKTITEINEYIAENDEINIDRIYEWQAETDEYYKVGTPDTLDEIKFDRGWSQTELEDEILKRKLVIAYLIKNGMNRYPQVAATFQAFMNDPEETLILIAKGLLEEKLDDLNKMESVNISVDPEAEANVPRPEPGEEILKECDKIIDNAEHIIEEHRNKELHSNTEDLAKIFTQQTESIEVEPDNKTETENTHQQLETSGELPEGKENEDDEFGGSEEPEITDETPELPDNSEDEGDSK